MNYKFYVNVQQDQHGRLLGFHGYEKSHTLELAYQGEVAGERPDLHVCELLFGKFNINHPADYHNRSMSVGDVVVLDATRAYACESFGWKEVHLPTQEQIQGKQFTAGPQQSGPAK